jgi:hypothetical protein
MTTRFFILLFILSFVLSACGGTVTEEVTAESDRIVLEQTEISPAFEVEELPSLALEMDIPAISLITPPVGGGTRPVLEWVAVEDADHYIVWVRTPTGKPYWSWLTSDTSVPVGGLPKLNEDAGGPSVVEGMTWSVIALDDEGTIIAASNHRPIAP